MGDTEGQSMLVTPKKGLSTGAKVAIGFLIAFACLLAWYMLVWSVAEAVVQRQAEDCRTKHEKMIASRLAAKNAADAAASGIQGLTGNPLVDQADADQAAALSAIEAAHVDALNVINKFLTMVPRKPIPAEVVTALQLINSYQLSGLYGDDVTAKGQALRDQIADVTTVIPDTEEPTMSLAQLLVEHKAEAAKEELQRKYALEQAELDKKQAAELDDAQKRADSAKADAKTPDAAALAVQNASAERAAILARQATEQIALMQAQQADASEIAAKQAAAAQTQEEATMLAKQAADLAAKQADDLAAKQAAIEAAAKVEAERAAAAAAKAEADRLAAIAAIAAAIAAAKAEADRLAAIAAASKQASLLELVKVTTNPADEASFQIAEIQAYDMKGAILPRSAFGNYDVDGNTGTDGYGGDRALDGDGTNNYYKNDASNWYNVAHTGGGVGTHYMRFWLTQPIQLSKVVVWNRVDCCQNRLAGTVLNVKNAAGAVIKQQALGGVYGAQTVTL